MDYKKIFDKFEDENIFIKTTVQPSMDSAQKAALNRKGNVLFNSGDIEGARRIFMSTGYSDGLCRVGDYYKSKNRPIEALRMYWIAPDHTKAEPLIIDVVGAVQAFMYEKEDDVENKNEIEKEGPADE
jgi:hypothetical protein